MTDTKTRTRILAIGGIALVAVAAGYWAFSSGSEAPAASPAEELHATVAEFSYTSDAQDFPYGSLVEALKTPDSALLSPTAFAAYEPVKLEDGSYRILLIDVVFADTPIDSLSFVAKGIDENTVQISDVSLTSPLILGDGDVAATLTWTELSWEGTYDLLTSAYTNLDIRAEGITMEDTSGTTSLSVDTFALSNALTDGTLASDLWLTDLTLQTAIDSATLTYSLPQAELRGTTTGLSGGQNPFAAMNFQLGAGLDLLSPEDALAAMGQAGDFELTAAPSILTLEDFSRVTFDFGALTATGSGEGYQSAGEGTASYKYVLDSLAYADPASGLSVLTGPIEATLGATGLDYTAALATTEGTDALNDPESGTYTRLAAYLQNGFGGQMDLTVRNISIADPNTGLDIFIENQGFGLSLAQADGAAQASLDMTLGGLEHSAYSPEGLIGGTLPSEASLRLALSGMDMESLAGLLTTLPRSGSIEDDAAVAADIEAALPQLAEWFMNAGGSVQPTLDYDAPALALSVEGDMPLDATALYGLGGGLTLTIEDFPAFADRVNAASQSGDPSDQAVAGGLSGLLFFLPAFATPDENGTLTLNLTFDEDGRPLLNDFLIPGL